MCGNHCLMCEGNPENEWNTFLDCSQAKSGWATCGLLSEVKLTVEAPDNFRECLFKLLQSLTEASKLTFVMILWAL